MKKAAKFAINLVTLIVVLNSLLAITSSILGAVGFEDTNLLRQWAYPPQININDSLAFVEQEVCMNYPNPEIELCYSKGSHAPMYVSEQLQPSLFGFTDWGVYFMDEDENLYFNATHSGWIYITGDKLRIPMLISQIFTWLGVLWPVLNFRGFALHAVENGIINRINAKRFRNIAAYVLAVPIFIALFTEWKIAFFAREFAKFNFQGLDIILTRNIPYLWIIVALVGIALTLVLNRAAQLKEEHALTI